MAGSALTPSVIGGRSVRFRSEVSDIKALQVLSEEVVSLSRRDGYRSSFEWVDNITPVEDEETDSALRERVAEMLLSDPVPKSLDAILPDDLLDSDDSRAIAYVLYPGERLKAAASKNLTVARLSGLAVSAQAEGAASLALDRNLKFLDDGRSMIGTASVLECICADFQYDGEQIVAYDGDFYRVNPDFVSRIDAELNELSTSTIEFPPYKAETEPDYIERVRKNRGDNFIVLDRAMIRLDGEYGIEASDLVHSSGAMVHLKRKGKSSTLSHLFLQAANSCEVLRRSIPAQQKLNALVTEKAPSLTLAGQVNAVHAKSWADKGPIEVVTAILGDWRGRSVLTLPLFSRISLVQESRKITSLGYIPSIALIGMT